MSQNFLPRFSASFAAAALAAFSPVFIGDATAAQSLPTTQVVAQGVNLSSQLVDDAGVIDDSKEEEIASKLKNGISESQMKVYLVYTTDTPSGAYAAAEELYEQHGTGNVAIYVINPEAGEQGRAMGDSIRTSEATALAEKANKHYADGDFTAGAEAIANDVSNTASTASKVWTGAGAIALVGGGTAVVVWSRRNRKRNEAKQLEAARNIEPEATTDLVQQPVEVLRTLAEEELGSTDESIRKGEEELSVAESEFGAARTAELSRALRHSRNTLNKAYGMHQRVRSGMTSNNQEMRGLLVEIISSCGTADKNLDAQAEKFEKLRQELIDAPQQLEKLVQLTVSLRSRIPDARKILEDLKARVDDHLLASVEQNPDVAEVEVDEADKHVAAARELLAKPAGQQGGLIDEIGAARMAIRQADSQLVAVEHAEEGLRIAQQNLAALIDEVAGEIREAEQLLNSAARVDRDGLHKATTQAQTALEKARAEEAQNPLGCYSELLEADSALDIQLDEARGVENDFRRTVDMVDRTIADTEQRLVGVEDTLRNRRSIIGVDTRTTAQAARDALQFAHENRLRDPKQALLAAQNASQLANEAVRQARKDIDRFNDRHQGGGYGGGGGGSLITGMVLGSLLSNSGGFGGFGGGFGDGGGFGGGFGGGGDMSF